MLKYVSTFCVLLAFATEIQGFQDIYQGSRLKGGQARVDETTIAATEATEATSTAASPTEATAGTTEAEPTTPSPTPALVVLALRGYEYIEGLGYYKINNVRRTWLAAQEYCERQGSHMAIFNSENEATNLRALMQQNGGFGSYWVGVHDLDEEGTYETIFHHSLASTGYNTWYPNEPNGKFTENCLAFVYENETSSGLIDSSCTSEKWTICELEGIL